MLKVNFLHFCESAIVEQGTGNLSIINIFENINAQSFPALHPTMSVVAGFENNNPGIYDVELVFFSDEFESLNESHQIFMIAPDAGIK